jgi:hypothetical protein
LGGGTNIQYPAGNEQGQAGWDIGLLFHNIGDLAEALRGVLSGRSISRLAINLHGSPGSIDADSTGAFYPFQKLWNRYSSPLSLINVMLEPGAVVLIMGCEVASGDEGAAFLSDLSKTAFPRHKVVGFTTIGESLLQYRNGGYCSEPGMRDTAYQVPHKDLSLKPQLEREKEVLTLPWASEHSPHAKIALNGEIVFGAEPSTATDYSFQSYLPGTWSVAIGTWNGYFVFKGDGSVFWTDQRNPRQHSGRWGSVAGSIQWTFADDAPGYKRTFEVLTPLKPTLNGTITGGGGGAFVMSKQPY